MLIKNNQKNRQQDERNQRDQIVMDGTEKHRGAPKGQTWTTQLLDGRIEDSAKEGFLDKRRGDDGQKTQENSLAEGEIFLQGLHHVLRVWRNVEKLHDLVGEQFQTD